MAASFPDVFNLADYCLFDRVEEGLGDKIAIRWGERVYRYLDVAERAAGFAHYLKTIGVEPEQRVYVVLPDCPPFAWAFFGALAAGAVVTLGNPDAPTEDLLYVLSYVRASALVTIPRVAVALKAAIEASPHLKAVLLVPETATGGDPEAAVEPLELSAPFVVTESLAAVSAPEKKSRYLARFRTRRDDMAVWLFTSGSTGRPKAAMHTHRDFAFNTEVYAKRTIGYREHDVTVSVPRLYFGYATGTNLMFPFAVGATVGLYSERPTPEALARAVAAYRATVVTNVPTMMAKLIEHDEALERDGQPRLDLSSVRCHLSAGEALPPPLLARFGERFASPVYDGIGSAEMFHIYASNRPGDVKPGSLGRAVEGYEIRILAEDAEGPGAPPLPPGETGVLWVRGESVALGYYQDRDQSWATFHGAWCRTGDLFRVDEEGYLWFSGRADDLIKVSGLWVAPQEVEGCLMGHPSVAEAAVVGADEDGLTKPKAFVVLRDVERARLDGPAAYEKLADELREHVKSRLSKHKYPRWVIFVEDLPRNDRGKIDRKKLKDEASRS